MRTTLTMRIKIPLMILPVLLLLFPQRLNAFVVPRLPSLTVNPGRYMSSQEPMTQEQEEGLSDVDYRVLQSMLQDSKVDMKTEEDIKKLLERGTVKSAKSQEAPAPEEVEDSIYSSDIMRKFTDTKFWRKFSKQANDALESAKIWVANKVENDVKVLATLGIFFGDRIVKDVARALPAAAPKRILQLTNSSSYQEPVRPKSASEAMNRPSDEIKAVSREILDILSGKATNKDKSKKLRTAAPAGSAYMSERQNRAFTQKRKLEKQQRDVSRMAGSLMDTAYELNQDLRAESNPAGYKSEQVRNAIEAGVESTGKALRAAKDAARLAAAERKARRLQPAGESAVQQQRETSEYAIYDASFMSDELRKEAAWSVQNLRNCIKSPETTWLSDVQLDVNKETGVPKSIDEESINKLITIMIASQEDLESRLESLGGLDFEDLCDEIEGIRRVTDQLKARAATSISFDAAEKLILSIYGEESDILDLEQVRQRIRDGPPAPDPEPEIPYFTDDEGDLPYAKDEEVLESYVSLTGEIVDVVPEVFVSSRNFQAARENAEARDADQNFSNVAVELVTESDFDEAFEKSKVVKEVRETDEKGEPDIFTKALLRSLDVVLFVLEKTFTVAIPKTIKTTKVAAARIDDSLREGRGSTGWKPVKVASSRDVLLSTYLIRYG